MEKDYKYKGLKRNNLLYLKANGIKKNIFPIFFIFLKNDTNQDSNQDSNQDKNNNNFNNSLVVSIRKSVGNAIFRNRIRRRIRYIFQKRKISGVFLCIINSINKEQKQLNTSIDPYSFSNLEQVIEKFSQKFSQKL